MTSIRATLSAAAYERAAAYAPAIIARKLTGGVGDGYWLDDTQYFFSLAESDGDGGILQRPKIANAITGVVRDVISPAGLRALLPEKEPWTAHLGTARYDMPDPGTLAVIIGCDVSLIALEGPELVGSEVVDEAPALYSPDGRYAAYLQGHAIWIRERADGSVRRLSSEGQRHHAYGAAHESGISPLAGRKRAIPYGLWSADSQWFVTHRIDERHLPEGGLVEHAPSGGRRAMPHRYKVSAPEGDQATVEFVAFHLSSGRSVSSASRLVRALPFSPFVLKQCWFVGERLYFLDWDRFNAEVALVEMRLDDGALRTVLREQAVRGWIDLHPRMAAQPIIRILPDSRDLIWWSERDGHGHLYLYDLDSGMLRNRMTSGDWMVRDIVHVDETRGRVLFLASGFEDDPDPANRRLMTVNLDGENLEMVANLSGDMAIAPEPVSGVEQLKPYRPPYAYCGAAPTGKRIVVQTGAANKATQVLMLDLTVDRSLQLGRSNIEALWKAPTPQPFEVLAADGVTRLCGAMYFPTKFDATKSYPLVDYIYPGPQINWFFRRMPSVSGLSVQSVAELGAIGIVLETRGMPSRSRAFHQAGEGRLLEPQLSDHVAAIEQLCQRHSFIDPGRIGMFGQSGGGYATARAMFDYPKVFKVGVSVCGNHENRNYVAHWIDKYGPRPGSPERVAQSNIGAAHRLEGALLLIHGDMDDNVHPAHTLALSAALIAEGKAFEQLIVPGGGHSIILDNPYVVQRLWSFLARHLIGVEPPADFVLRWAHADGAAAIRMLSDNQ